METKKPKISCSYTVYQFIMSVFSVWYIRWLAVEHGFSTVKTWAIYETTCLAIIGFMCFVVAIIYAIAYNNSKNGR